MSDKNNLRWYRIPANPRQPWQRHDIGAGVHAGVAIGDIDGDGDPDVAPFQCLVREHRWLGDQMDGTSSSIRQSGPALSACNSLPNRRHRPRWRRRSGDDRERDPWRSDRLAGKRRRQGRKWNVHDLPHGDSAARGAYHSLAVEDFDNDGDFDIFSVEMEAIPGDRQPRWFIWENVDGQGARFVERVIFDGKLGGHEAVVADVDGDGDFDICSKLWRPRGDNANEGRNHADFLENRLIIRKVADR